MKNNNSNVSRETLCARLNEHLLPAQLSFSVEQCERLCGFWAEVVRWNKTHNLTAITDFESAIDLHFVDSILPASEKNVFSGCNKVLDLGTGAGFPGIPLSVLFPNISFYLLDKNHKKISFLHYVTSLFNFNNAVPVNNSFFSLTDKYDSIISRAVKVDDKIFNQCRTLINKNGWLIIFYSSNQDIFYSPHFSFLKKYQLLNVEHKIAFYQF